MNSLNDLWDSIKWINKSWYKTSLKRKRKNTPYSGSSKSYEKSKENPPRHIIIKMSKVKEKDRVLQTIKRNKKTCYGQVNLHKIIDIFFSRNFHPFKCILHPTLYCHLDIIRRLNLRRRGKLGFSLLAPFLNHGISLLITLGLTELL